MAEPLREDDFDLVPHAGDGAEEEVPAELNHNGELAQVLELLLRPVWPDDARLEVRPGQDGLQEQDAGAGAVQV